MKSKVKGDSHPHDVSPHHAERSENDQAFLDLLNALKGLMTLVDNGTLVRDTSKDHETNWAIAQLPLIMALKNAQLIIDKVELAQLEQHSTNAKGVPIAVDCPHCKSHWTWNDFWTEHESKLGSRN